MNNIIHITSNLKLGETLYKAGTVAQFDVTMLEELIKDGTIRVLEGVETIAEGVAKVAAEEAKKLADAEEAVAAEVAPANTWEATKEPVVAPETEETATDTTAEVAPVAPALAKFTVLKDFEVTNTESKNFGKHVEGDTIEADAIAAQTLIDNGTLAPVAPETGDNL